MRDHGSQFHQTVKTLIVFACALLAMVTSENGRFELAAQQDTIRLKFVPCQFANDDVKLRKAILEQLNKNADEGERYLNASVFYPTDSTFKVVNVFGEVSGGATYNPFGLNYLVKDGQITDEPLSGHVFRIDASNDSSAFTMYVDDFGRMGSDLGRFDIVFKNGVNLVKNTTKKNYARNFIGRPKESPTDFPKFDFSSRITPELAQLLNIDTLSIEPNDYYFPPENTFFTRDFNPEIRTLIYYRHHNGDEIEKILRVEKGGKVTERFLAKVASDPVMRLSTEFINDSIFREVAVYEETVADEVNLMVHDRDSIVTSYYYTDDLEFIEIAKDSFKLRIENHSLSNKLTSIRELSQGKSFTMNGRKWHWTFSCERRYDDGKPPRFINVHRSLYDETSKSVAINLPIDSTGNPEVSSDRLESFIDVNLDGYLDGKFYNASSSGSAGSFENVYLYDPKNDKFNHSELFSGYDIYIDSRNRIVYSYGKSGVYNFAIQQIHLDKNSRVQFVEIYRCTENSGKLDLTFRKIMDGKTIRKKSKTVPKIDSREEIEFELMQLGGKN